MLTLSEQLTWKGSQAYCAIIITNTYLKRCLVRAKDDRIPEHYVVLCGSSAHAGRWVLLIFRKCVLLTNQEK